MRRRLATLLLGSAAAVLTFDGVMHGLLWGEAGLRTIRAAQSVAPGFNPQFDADLQVLWIADIVNLLATALVCGLAARWPRIAAPPILLVVALIPLALGVLLVLDKSVWWVPAIQVLAAGLMIGGAVLRIGLTDSDSNENGRG